MDHLWAIQNHQGKEKTRARPPQVIAIVSRPMSKTAVEIATGSIAAVNGTKFRKKKTKKHPSITISGQPKRADTRKPQAERSVRTIPEPKIRKKKRLSVWPFLGRIVSELITRSQILANG